VQLERDYLQHKPQYNDLTAGQIGNALRNVMELPLMDPAFADFILYEPVLDIVQAVLDTTEFSFHNYKCVVKAPHVSSRFRWHRDLPYLEHSTPNLVTAIVCLDPMTQQNGATVVLPGTHRVPHEQVTDADGDIPDDKLPAGVPHVTVCCPAGSVVLFHVNIIHGGAANRSPIPRRNVIGIWAGPDTYPVTAARYAYQDLMPRSTDPARQRQVAMSFPHLFQGGGAGRAPAVSASV
jgi:ectoine hydroxylase-related dioxygenase (phytanoyl-CoA dioxygenase family)